jgi:hypothetical protein
MTERRYDDPGEIATERSAMDPLELVALMAATLRAGKGGTQAKAWGDAMGEAVFGLSAILVNEQKIREQLSAVARDAEGKPPLIETGTTLITP